MIEETIARPGQESTRVTRGIALHREHGGEIERVGINTYRVPSCTGTGTYTVYTDLRCCSCPDHPRAKAAGERCKHFYAVEIVVSKRRAPRRRVGLPLGLSRSGLQRGAAVEDRCGALPRSDGPGRPRTYPRSFSDNTLWTSFSPGPLPLCDRC